MREASANKNGWSGRLLCVLLNKAKQIASESIMNRGLLNLILLVALLLAKRTSASEPSGVFAATLPVQAEVTRDGAGRLVQQSSVSGSQVVTRDASGRVLATTTTQPDRATHRDASGRLLATTQTSSTGKQTTRDRAGRLTATATPNTRGDVITYRDASGRLLGTKATGSNGRVTFRNTSGRQTGPDFK